MSVLTFTEYLPPVKFKSGKTGPSKYKAGGVEYIAPRGSQIELNTPYECEVEVSENGRFTDHVIKSFFPVRQIGASEVRAAVREHLESGNTAPLVIGGGGSAPLTSHPQDKGAVATPAASSWESKDRLISRQVAFKGAVEIVTAKIAARLYDEEADIPGAVDYFTELFFGLLLEQPEQQPAGNVRRPEATVISPASLPSARR